MRVVMGAAKAELERLRDYVARHKNNEGFTSDRGARDAEAEIDAIVGGDAFRFEPPEAYWVRRCHELAEELYMLESGKDPECLPDSAGYEALRMKKIRQLDTARAVVNRASINIDVDVRQINQTLVVAF